MRSASGESGLIVSATSRPPGRSFGGGELEEADERRRRQVLDDLRGEDPAERAVVERLEVVERVCLLDVEALAAAYATMSASASTPRASMPASRRSAEELAAAAADVEHRARRRGSRRRTAAAGRGSRCVEPRIRLSKAK